MVIVTYGDPMRLVRWRRAPRSFTGRWRKLFHEVSKFGAIGAFNLVLNYAVFNLLVLTIFGNGQLKANVAATIVATTSSYFMNRHWTYRDRPKSTLHREYALFFLFNLAGMVIELGVLGLAKYGLGITTLVAFNVAKGFGIGLGMVFRFWTYRTVVFREAPVATTGTLYAAGPTPPTGGGKSADGTVAAPAHRPVAAEFAHLTGPLEVELDPPLDSAIQAELDAEFTANRTTQR
jgi:putative flippase GtrA